jgi:hypothetical protein
VSALSKRYDHVVGFATAAHLVECCNGGARGDSRGVSPVNSVRRNAMGDKGRSDRAKKEAQKKPLKTAKEKRTEKREKKSRSE